MVQLFWIVIGIISHNLTLQARANRRLHETKHKSSHWSFNTRSGRWVDLHLLGPIHREDLLLWILAKFFSEFFSGGYSDSLPLHASHH